MILRKVNVYVQDRLAGVLSETDDQGYVFQYDPAYLDSEVVRPVSLTLPVRAEPYTSSVLFSFFDGLLPEGWLLDVVSENWKVDRHDRFGILMLACKDSPGNVRIGELI